MFLPGERPAIFLSKIGLNSTTVEFLVVIWYYHDGNTAISGAQGSVWFNPGSRSPLYLL